MSNKVTITNAGINGHNTADLLARLDRDVLSKSPELVILMVGTNDMLNLPYTLSYTEYEENYQTLISRITQKAKLVMMTIPPVHAEYILERVSIILYKNVHPDVKVDQANAIVRTLAAKNNIPLIDHYNILQACGGATAEPNSLFMNMANAGISDGVHPTVDGYRVIGAAVYQAITLLMPEVTNIVCFGDSITYGYEMQGQGTTDGDSYPAVLKRMLNSKV